MLRIEMHKKNDNEDGTWPWIMCPHTLKKILKPFIESFTTKQSHKSAYTTPKRQLEERQCEQAKAKTNVSHSKMNFVPRWKSSTKKGKSTSTSGCRRRRTPLVSLDGTTCVLKVNAHIAQCIPLHEQGPMFDTIVVMEVGWNLESTPNVCEKLERVL